MSSYHDEIELKDILMSLSEYRVLLLKKKFYIIICSFLFLLFGLAYSFVSESEYNADLTFIVEQESGGVSLGSVSGLASQFGFDIGGTESSTFSQSNILELLKSRRVIISTLMQSAKVNGKTDLLIEHYLELNKIKEAWESNENFLGVSFHDKSSHTHDSISGVILPYYEIIASNKDYLKKWRRTKYFVQSVYDYAVISSAMLNAFEDTLSNFSSSRKRKKYLSKANKQLKKEFGSEIRNMSITRGNYLMKLGILTTLLLYKEGLTQLI